MKKNRRIQQSFVDSEISPMVGHIHSKFEELVRFQHFAPKQASSKYGDMAEWQTLRT